MYQLLTIHKTNKTPFFPSFPVVLRGSNPGPHTCNASMPLTELHASSATSLWAGESLGKLPIH